MIGRDDQQRVRIDLVEEATQRLVEGGDGGGVGLLQAQKRLVVGRIDQADGVEPWFQGFLIIGVGRLVELPGWQELGGFDPDELGGFR